MNCTNDIELREYNAFKNFITGTIENRTDPTNIQLTQGENGYVIPTSICDKIVSKVKDRVPWLALCNLYVTNGKLSVPVYDETDDNFINADYVNEGSSLIDNIGKFSSVDLNGFLIGALTLVSKKLINNSSIDIVDFVINKIIDSIIFKLDHEFCVGSSKIQGIINTDNIIESASVDAITYDELIELSHAIPDIYRCSPFTGFIMNSDTYTAICKLSDNTNRKLVRNNGYLLEYPVYMSNSMPSIAGDNVAIVFANFSGYDIKFDALPQVSVLREIFADKNMDAFVCVGEFDGRITNQQKIAVLRMKGIARDLDRTATNCSIIVKKGSSSVSDGDGVINDFDILTITATANEGYILTSLTVNDDSFTSGESIEVSEDITIVGTAKALRDLSISTDDNCSVSVSRGSDLVEAGENVLVDDDVIVITATADEGYSVSLSVNSDSFTSGESITVSSDVSIVATSSEIVADNSDDNSDDNGGE